MHWQTPEPEFINQITDLAGTETNVGIKINSSIDNGTINVSVDVNFGIDYGDLRLVVYLIEDNLIYSQNNYYPNLYGGQNPIQNFEHNNVLSDIYTSFMGEDIPSPHSGEEQTFSYSKSLTEFVEDQANTRIVAFVIDESISTCLNVRSAKLGETIEYQLYN